MNISTETVGRLFASGRNYAGQIIAFASGIGLMSAAQDKGLMDSLNEMYSGAVMVVHGATSFWTIAVVAAAPIVGPIIAKWASNSAKTENQAIAVQKAVVDPKSPITPAAKEAIVVAASEVSK